MNYDRIWTVMNDLQESFNQIGSINFLVDELQKAVNDDDRKKIVDTTHALIAFLPVYENGFDEKFEVAWEEVVLPAFVNMKNLDKKDVRYEDICKYYNSNEFNP